MEKHFDINEQGLSIRCKLICSNSDKTARTFEHIAIVTHGFGKQLCINANTVAMLPIARFALTGVVTAKDLKEIDWAVI